MSWYDWNFLTYDSSIDFNEPPSISYSPRFFGIAASMSAAECTLNMVPASVMDSDLACTIAPGTEPFKYCLSVDLNCIIPSSFMTTFQSSRMPNASVDAVTSPLPGVDEMYRPYAVLNATVESDPACTTVIIS